MTSNELKLLFVPSEYWNNSNAQFSIIEKKEGLPTRTDFFLLWLGSESDEIELKFSIERTFPNIPVKNLLSVRMNIAVPQNENSALFSIKLVYAKIVPIKPMLGILFNQEIKDLSRSTLQPYYLSNSVRIYSYLTKLAYELLNRGSFIPTLEFLDTTSYIGYWNYILNVEYDQERFTSILEKSDWSSHNLPINFIKNHNSKTNLSEYLCDMLWHPSYLFSKYVNSIVDLVVKKTFRNLKREYLYNYYNIQGDLSAEFSWDLRFLLSLMETNYLFKLSRYHEIVLPTLIDNWTKRSFSLINQLGIALIFKLNTPTKLNDNRWPLELELKKSGQKVPVGISSAWNNLNNNELELVLRALLTASNIFSPLSKVLENTTPNNIELDSNEVIEFLKYPKDLLMKSGFTVLLPSEFAIGGKQRLIAKLVLSSKNGKKKESTKTSSMPSMFDYSSIIKYNWNAYIEDNLLSQDEFRQVLNSQNPLVKLGDQWLLVDQADLQNLQILLENENLEGQKNYFEALQLGLAGVIEDDNNESQYEVVIEGDVKELIEQIRSLNTLDIVPISKLFNGTLRHYQQTALNWMVSLTIKNFGLCLADDMGLGKTIEVIAFLSHLKENYPEVNGSYLIICPTSIIFNWEREIKKFAPTFDVYIHHGKNRIKNLKGFSKLIENHKAIITSYGTLRNDIDFLQSFVFNGIIVDESQNIKNYATQQTQAVYKLQGNFRICLSGTPIENRLLELWTLFEFLNPGLLGERSRFINQFVVPIERFQDIDIANKLRSIISPFILRREKTDTSIIQDLPPKNEMKIYVELSKQQKRLYEQLIDETVNSMKLISSKEKKSGGFILQLITKVKQICNHPLHYLKVDVSIDSEEELEKIIRSSPKVERLVEMVDEVILNDGKALIFTQYKKMGDILIKILTKKFPYSILFFHGGTPEAKRSILVDEFQSESSKMSPIMVLSLKAGGTGLNLTKATTVFHFDRWWNPAVENQATDRAYRIGQKNVVNVYKFVTLNTIEEKIDQLLEEKQELSKKILASKGETWISEMFYENLEEFLNIK